MAESQRGKKFNDDIKEKALALLAVNNNVQYVADQLGLKYSTVKTWEKNALKDKEGGKLAELRNKKKEEFVTKAWSIIEKSNLLLERKIDRALEQEVALDKMIEQAKRNSDISKEEVNNLARQIGKLSLDNLGQLSTIIGTLYDKQALINKEATVNHGVDSSLEEALKKLDGEEM